MYSVKETFYTLQGEGVHAGRAAVFLRFAGCNLWNGKEKNREAAICKFCDTDFAGTDGEGGGKFKTAGELANHVKQMWQMGNKSIALKGKPFVVCTGGEPGLQLDSRLVASLHQSGFEVAIESNGTVDLSGRGIDWICISPKADSKIVQTKGNELKLVYPQPDNDPRQFEHMSFDHFFISPKDGAFDDTDTLMNRNNAVGYCLANPQWKLSLQTHKIVGLK